MGGCLILESLVLFHWCERNGLGPLGVTGLSMGGHMASLAATNWPKPLVLVPCLSWSTASAVFLQGVMSQSINWDLLEDQYLSDGIYREKLSKMVTIIDEAFLAGKKFARTYSETVDSNKPNELNVEPTLDSKISEESAPDISETAAKKVKLDAEPDIPESKAEKQMHDDDSGKTTVHMNETKLEDIDPVKEKGNQIIDVSRNVIESPKDILKPEIFGEVEELNKQLKEMVEERIISKGLYDKLTSNQKFELDPEDIVDINQLHEGRLREVLQKCKVANNIKKEIDDLSSSSNKIEEKPSPGEEKDRIATALATNPERSLAKNHWNVSDLARTDLWFNWPFNRKEGKKIDISKIHWRDREALQFMRGVMDECTHLSNFTIPFDTSLIIAVCAKHDAYVPRDDVGTLEEIWPGAEVRYVDAGHVSAYILHQSLFRSCIKEAFERSKKKWKDGKHINETPNV
ncbi:abhydrolase domain containing 18 domain-containing protein [Phthorimaea operculella]|nr:abhydrolase domain containing 18 domain-containing protein [Phthorimaea operculella]